MKRPSAPTSPFKDTALRYGASPVVTTRQLAAFYGCDDVRIRQNYLRHRSRYAEGRHYYLLRGPDLQVFMGCQPENSDLPNWTAQLMLWTIPGALLHAKTLTSDRAWAVTEGLCWNGKG